MSSLMSEFIRQYQKNFTQKSNLLIVYQLSLASYEAYLILTTIYDLKNIIQPFLFLSVWGITLSIGYRLVSVIEYIKLKILLKYSQQQQQKDKMLIRNRGHSHLTHFLFVAAFSFELVNLMLYWLTLYPAIINWGRGEYIKLQSQEQMTQSGSEFKPSLATEIQRFQSQFFSISFRNYYFNMLCYGTMWIDFVFSPIKFHTFYLFPTVFLSLIYCLVNYIYSYVVMPVYPNLTWKTKEDAILIFLAYLVGIIHFWFGKFVSKTLKSDREIVYIKKDELKYNDVIPVEHIKKLN